MKTQLLFYNNINTHEAVKKGYIANLFPIKTVGTEQTKTINCYIRVNIISRFQSTWVESILGNEKFFFF